MIKAMKVNSNDNVAILLDDIKKGETCDYDDEYSQKANQDIPFGHKIALRDIAKGEDIVKYGYIIGYATQPISRGDWVHNHNIRSDRGRIKKKRSV
jgi:altronate dehydratase